MGPPHLLSDSTAFIMLDLSVIDYDNSPAISAEQINIYLATEYTAVRLQ